MQPTAAVTQFTIFITYSYPTGYRTVNWVTTADSCVQTVDPALLDMISSKCVRFPNFPPNPSAVIMSSSVIYFTVHGETKHRCDEMVSLCHISGVNWVSNRAVVWHRNCCHSTWNKIIKIKLWTLPDTRLQCWTHSSIKTSQAEHGKHTPFIIHLQTRFTLGQMTTKLFTAVDLHLQFTLKSHVFLANLSLFFHKLRHLLFVWQTKQQTINQSILFF